MALEVFQEMSVKGPPEELTAFIQGVEDRLTNGWTRDLAREKSLLSEGRWYAFACSVDHASLRDAATLYLADAQEGALYVSTIVPTVVQSLGFHGYNRILMEFHDAFAHPAAGALGIDLRLTDDRYRLKDHVSPETYLALQGFSKGSNRGVPHPLDMQRWRQLLLSLHAEKWPVGPGTIERWLVEEERWPEDRASELRLEMSHARDLLRDYDTRLSH